jgi:hypothetical protein
MRYQLTLVRMAVFKQKIMRVGEDAEQRESLHTIGGKVN